MAAPFPLRVKLQLATVAAVVAFGALNAFIVSRLQFATLREEQELRIRFAGQLLASRLVEPLLFGDRLAVQKLLEETRSLDESFYAVIVRDPQGAQQHSGSLTAAGLLSTRQEVFPILDGKLGEVKLVVSLEPLEEQVSSVLRWLAGMILLILISGMGVAMLLAKSLTKPVDRMVAFARSFQLEGEPPALQVRTKDELEELAEAFVAMAKRVSQLHQQATEHTREMARLEHLAAVGTLAAGVAHEINNPLAGIRTGLERLIRRLPSDEQTHRYAETLRDALARIEAAVKGLLRFARATEVQLEPVSLPEVVEQAWELVRPCWESQQLRLETRFSPAEPLVLADRAKLREVFLNLFLNACEAMGGRGTVTVSSERGSQEVRVVVSDTGPGVPEELRDRIFLPFFTTNTQRGTGLGLAVSQTALREMGGELRLLARSPGAHFELTLRVAKP